MKAALPRTTSTSASWPTSDAGAGWWHVVDMIWIVLLPLLYLLGTPSTFSWGGSILQHVAAPLPTGMLATREDGLRLKSRSKEVSHVRRHPAASGCTNHQTPR